MSENNETHAQIVAEVRDLSKSAKLDLELGIYGHLPTIYGKPFDVYFAELADRLETSTKREREKLSSCYVRSTREAARIIVRSGEVNAAKMYKALITIREKCVIYNNALAEEIDAICGNAISAPARNCDVYDKEEVRMAYHLHGDGLMTMQAVVDWLYSAKKEYGDESPRTEQESEVKE